MFSPDQFRATFRSGFLFFPEMVDNFDKTWGFLAVRFLPRACFCLGGVGALSSDQTV
jgi:hypothetical protein